MTNDELDGAVADDSEFSVGQAGSRRRLYEAPRITGDRRLAASVLGSNETPCEPGDPGCEEPVP